jgi:hypothetical protein
MVWMRATFCHETTAPTMRPGEENEMMRFLSVPVLCTAISACGLLRDDGDVVQESADDITIKIGYDAAVKGQHPERLAAEHCAENGKRAIW